MAPLWESNQNQANIDYLLKHPIVTVISTCLSVNRKIQKKKMLFITKVDERCLPYVWRVYWLYYEGR